MRFIGFKNQISERNGVFVQSILKSMEVYEVDECDAFNGSKTLFRSTSLEKAKEYYHIADRSNPHAFFGILKVWPSGAKTWNYP